jgi:hypothetical protein
MFCQFVHTEDVEAVKVIWGDFETGQQILYWQFKWFEVILVNFTEYKRTNSQKLNILHKPS